MRLPSSCRLLLLAWLRSACSFRIPCHAFECSSRPGTHIFCVDILSLNNPIKPARALVKFGHQLRSHHMTLHGYWSTERRSARYDTDDDARAARSSMSLSNKSRQQASMCSCCNANHRSIVQSTFHGIRKSCRPAPAALPGGASAALLVNIGSNMKALAASARPQAGTSKSSKHRRHGPGHTTRR